MSDEKLYAYEVTPIYDEAYDPPEYFGNMISMREASVGERLGWEKCETCGGWGVSITSPCAGNAHIERCPTCEDCPNCVDGWTPPAELVERIKSAIGETFIREMGWGESKPFAALEVYAIAEKQAKQAVLEQARWIGEQ